METNEVVRTSDNHGVASASDKRFARGVLGTVIAILAVLTAISAVLLAIRLSDYINRDSAEVLLKANVSKRLEIFSVQYDNKSGEITVTGMDGQRVIAPGTKVDYTVRLRNKDKIAIDYELVLTVEYTSEHTVPVRFRMIDDDENYLIGDEKTWVALEDIGQVSDMGTIVKGGSEEYEFQWKWEFESGDDEYDTFLGDLAKDEIVGVKVGFEIHAEANTDIGANGGIMGSGLGDILIAGFALLLLLAAIVLLIVYLVKRRKHELLEDGAQNVRETAEIADEQTQTQDRPEE